MSNDTAAAVRQEASPLAMSGKRVVGSIIRLHADDNVVIARTDVTLGETLEGAYTVPEAKSRQATRSRRATSMQASQSVSTT